IGDEALRGDHVRRFVDDGADVVVALADAGRWGRATGGRQLLALARPRAVETRRAGGVATVSGPPPSVLPARPRERRAGWMEEEAVERVVPLQPDATLYTHHGDWPGRVALFGAGWFLVVLGVATAFFRRPAPAPRYGVRQAVL